MLGGVLRLGFATAAVHCRQAAARRRGMLWRQAVATPIAECRPRIGWTRLDSLELHIYDIRYTIYARIGSRWLLGVGAADFYLKAGQQAHGIFFPEFCLN